MSQTLPPELLIKIFKMAAASSRETRQSLSIVSSWSRKIALPYMFHIVNMTPKILYRFLILEPLLIKPFQIPASFLVRAAWGDYAPYNAPRIADLCSLFPELTHLSMPVASWEWKHREEICSYSHGVDLPCFKPGLHLYLRACGKHAFDPLYNLGPERKRCDPMTLSFALTITHLHLEAVGQCLTRDLEYFQALTHIALTSTAQSVLDICDLSTLLSTRSNLQCLVFVFRDTKGCCALFYLKCMRILPMIQKEDSRIRWTHARGSAYEDWESECTGKWSIWDD
jgi:hypothetical protein